jgi:hypothetical protein
MLNCPTIGGMMAAANACANSCDFGSLGGMDPATGKLWGCLVNAPGGPPVCESCFSPQP